MPDTIRRPSRKKQKNICAYTNTAVSLPLQRFDHPLPSPADVKQQGQQTRLLMLVNQRKRNMPKKNNSSICTEEQLADDKNYLALIRSKRWDTVSLIELESLFWDFEIGRPAWNQFLSESMRAGALERKRTQKTEEEPSLPTACIKQGQRRGDAVSQGGADNYQTGGHLFPISCSSVGICCICLTANNWNGSCSISCRTIIFNKHL